ncbi:MAG: hypothetical protein ACTHJ8_13560 [Mucilaginibacter sp.]
MSAKPTITRTYGQIHFEDLDPKRFEDLVRQLIYDFKDWQSIEATGRGGTDDGFDIRAFEKNYRDTSEIQDETEIEETQPMDGSQWMIQCKREQSLGPIRIRSIIKENIDPENPPYGYILAVSSNISKRTFDAFREELQKLNVLEFYIWGKAALEDMLYQPKNDRILFTFFGISLTTRRRSRATEVRATTVNKNKIFSVIGTGSLYQPVLIRDLKDENYPYPSLYPDFDQNPRWGTYTAFENHPRGLVFHIHEYYAFVDVQAKEYDYCTFVDIVDRQDEDPEDYQANWKKRTATISNWELFPSINQGYYIEDAIVKYKDMVVIDAKGDAWNERPHIFVDYIKGTPFSGWRKFIRVGNDEIDITDFKRVNKFPEKIEKIKPNQIHADKVVKFSDAVYTHFRHDRHRLIIALDDHYDYLQKRDVLTIEGVFEGETESLQYMVTTIYEISVKKYLDQVEDPAERKEWLTQQLGKVPSNNTVVKVYELKHFHSYELDEDN